MCKYNRNKEEKKGKKAEVSEKRARKKWSEKHTEREKNDTEMLFVPCECGRGYLIHWFNSER